MKAVFLFLSAWILFQTTTAQSLEWVTTIGDVATDQGKSVALDTFGNVYATGTFRGKVDVDPGPDTFFLTAPPGKQAVYVVKLTRFQQLVWAKALGSGTGLEITIDNQGYVDVAGTFTGSSDFNPGPGIATLTSHGDEDIFIAQLSKDGVFQWAVGYGGPEKDLITSIAIDTANNIYSTGYFRDTMDINPGPLEKLLIAAGETDAFIQKLSHAGVYIWSHQFGDTRFDNGAAVRVSSTGNILLIGDFFGMVDFDPGSGVHILIADDSLDVFILALNGAGEYIWAKKFGGVDDVIATDAVLDAQNNILITGYFKNSADFNPAVLDHYFLTSLGGTDIFLDKLDPNGNFLWVKQIGGPGPLDKSEAMLIGKTTNIYITGNFIGVCDFDPGPGVYNLYSPSSLDMFVVQLDATGQLRAAQQFGGPSDDYARNLVVDYNQKVFLTGTFTDSADFSPGRDTVLVRSHGGQDAFVARVNFIPYISDLRGPVKPCAGELATYSINAENVTQFNWAFPSNWTVIGSSNNDTVTVLTNGAGGNVTVVGSGFNGTSFPLTLFVRPVFTPGLSNLTGPFSPCPGELRTYRVQSTNLDSVSWSFPPDWQIVGSVFLDSVKVIVGASNGLVTVSGHNACGDTSLQRNLFPQKLPVISNLIGDLAPCIGSTLTYRVQQTAVQHYNWTFPPGWTILGNSDSVAVKVIVGAQSGQVVITGTNTCGDTTYSSAINPVAVPAASISVNTTVLTITPSAQSYQWYRNSSPIPGANQNPYTATQNGFYFAKVTYATGCMTNTDTVQVIISGIQDPELDKVYIYPIPAQEMIHVAGIDPDFHFDLYDLAGRLLSNGYSSTGDILMVELISGVYFLRVEKGDREYTFLFIKN